MYISPYVRSVITYMKNFSIMKFITTSPDPMIKLNVNDDSIDNFEMRK